MKLSRHAQNKCRLYKVDHAFVASLVAMPGSSVNDPATGRVNIVREVAAGSGQWSTWWSAASRSS